MASLQQMSRIPILVRDLKVSKLVALTLSTGHQLFARLVAIPLTKNRVFVVGFFVRKPTEYGNEID